MAVNAPFLGLLIASLAAMGQAPSAGARATDAGRVMLVVDVRSRTSLQVSTSELRFDVVDEAATPRVEVDYRAAARTRSDHPVMLTVDPAGEVRTLDGESVRGLAVRLEAAGARDTTLAAGGSHIVARWTGSGVRSGRVAFTLLGAHKPGVYLLALKFALSVP